MGRRCVMGCSSGRHASHAFPRNHARRAEWCHILGIRPTLTDMHICSDHFSNCYMWGNRLSKYAVPNPPESRKINSTESPKINPPESRKVNDPLVEIANSIFHRVTNSETGDKSGNSIYENEVKKELLSGETLHSNDHNQQNTEESEENGEKVEDFEIRKGSTNDMIIKGRFVQTNDYLVVSYTPPRKWSLQQQVKMLDHQCTHQLKRIRQLNTHNQSLYRELRTHEKLLPKLRYLQSQNRLLQVQLKMYKMKEKERRKRTKEKRLNE